MRPTTYTGKGLLTPRTALAFLVGILVGGVLLWPILPETVGGELGALMAGGGSVIAIGFGTLALLMVLLAIFYQLTLS